MCINLSSSNYVCARVCFFFIFASATAFHFRNFVSASVFSFYLCVSENIIPTFIARVCATAACRCNCAKTDVPMHESHSLSGDTARRRQIITIMVMWWLAGLPYANTARMFLFLWNESRVSPACLTCGQGVTRVVGCGGDYLFLCDAGAKGLVTVAEIFDNAPRGRESNRDGALNHPIVQHEHCSAEIFAFAPFACGTPVISRFVFTVCF